MSTLSGGGCTWGLLGGWCVECLIQSLFNNMYVTEPSVMSCGGRRLVWITTVLLCDHIHTHPHRYFSTFTVPVLTVSGGSDNHTSILRLLVSECGRNVVTYY